MDQSDGRSRLANRAAPPRAFVPETLKTAIKLLVAHWYDGQ
ncbi:MAG: hypothetical protein WD278_12135 [Pirellulales bacterium]